ncbi:ATPase, T2SS/T4P/T4SS family [Cohnella sp. GCM10020058]|uniref:ATPase, T2SS/T4P/T4SS family n=1 Tax=Cohnella sp. GCM10020058 TaxID=3317330 RepID=UPI00362EBD69
MRQPLTRFNVRTYMIQVGQDKAPVPAVTKLKQDPTDKLVYVGFDQVVLKVKEEFDLQFERVKETKEGQDLTNLENEAMIGKAEAVTTLIEKIESYLQANKIANVKIPVYYLDLQKYGTEEQRKYSNLSHAIYHEIYGLNALAYWLTKPKSYAMQLIGRMIWIFDPEKGRNVLMPFQLQTDEVLKKIIRSLESQKTNDKLTEAKPVLELDTYTGERVQIVIEPRVRRTIITFRRILPEYVTLEDQREKGLYPSEFHPFMQGVAHAMPNIVITGEMGTAKTALLRAIIHERPDYITGFGIEDDYELHISTVNPNKKFIEFILRGSSFVDALKHALRTDAVYGVMQEVRMDEAEGAMVVSERLQKGFLATTHIIRPDTIPERWGQMIVRVNGSGNEQSEQRRVAENLDLIILMGQDETQTRKRIMSIQELRYNRQNGEISTHQIMRFNLDSGKYQYRFDLSPVLISEMKAKNSKWTDAMIQTLQNLEKSAPIPDGEGVTIFNPAIANPQYRLALATEQMAAEQKRTNEILQQLLMNLKGGANAHSIN